MIVSLATLGFSLMIIDHSQKKLMWAVGFAITTVMSFVAFFSNRSGSHHMGLLLRDLFIKATRSRNEKERVEAIATTPLMATPARSLTAPVTIVRTSTAPKTTARASAAVARLQRHVEQSSRRSI
ncbi:hypothetical protein QYF36_008553 [Acer negundo]|nr:hypothetical protein QYF36_008553 [Acer negundo]